MNRLTSMIRNRLDASRVRAGERLALQFVQCDLTAVIREVLSEMKAIYRDRFILESQGQIQGNCSSDGLRRAVENLIVNAINYGERARPITVSMRRSKLGIEIEVHNEGPKIPQKEIPLLFQQYRRAHSAQAGGQHSWGLGLTLVKGVVDAHKGKIRVESEHDSGTSFILELPFEETGVASAAMKSAESALKKGARLLDSRAPFSHRLFSFAGSNRRSNTAVASSATLILTKRI